ncbi:MOSC domain-containing protein [Nodosilinea sp. LEGE 07088]|uniref:MOSC domain-containing protein n=1 Tax=Nodosilinea sp. LEGE 07088 TaxID=2777968 RepID=UPI001D15DC2B
MVRKLRAESEPPTKSQTAIEGAVKAVSRSADHGLSKANQSSIQLLAGLGVAGDAHAGATVQHRSRVAQNPTQPNLRQVHLIQAELFDQLKAAGFEIAPGAMGENITTHGLDLLALPVKTRLHIGESAIVEVAGLRNPCQQLDGLQPGLMAAVLDRDEQGQLVRKAGVMGIVVASGEVLPGDRIQVELPPEPHQPLDRV